jgi:hypothetical protein
MVLLSRWDVCPLRVEELEVRDVMMKDKEFLRANAGSTVGRRLRSNHMTESVTDRLESLSYTLFSLCAKRSI